MKSPTMLLAGYPLSLQHSIIDPKEECINQKLPMDSGSGCVCFINNHYGSKYSLKTLLDNLTCNVFLVVILIFYKDPLKFQQVVS